MTNRSGDVTRQYRDGLAVLPVIVTCLFIFVFLQSSGANLSLRPDSGPQTSAEKYEVLEERAAGRKGIYDQLVWIIFGFAGCYLNFLKRSRALYTWARAWPLLLLLALIIVSALWSSVPDIALRRAVKHFLLVATLAGVVIGASSSREILRLAVVFTGLLMVLNIACLIFFPSVATDYRGSIQGLHGHKNTAGVFAMVAVFVWFSAARGSPGGLKRAILFAGALLWFLFLIGTYSRTSIICTIVAIVLIIPLQYCFRKPSIGIVFGFFVSLLSLSAVFVLILFDVSFADLVDLLEGEKTTLTGRTTVWQIAYQAFLDNVLLGTGYGSLWGTGAMVPAEEYSDLNLTKFLVGLTQAHNGYLDILATLGTVGAIIFSIFLVSVIWNEFRALTSFGGDKDGRALVELSGFILVASLVHNLTQSTFLKGSILWISLLMCYLLLCSVGFQNNSDSSSASGRMEKHPLG